MTNMKDFKRYVKENIQNFPDVIEPDFFSKLLLEHPKNYWTTWYVLKQCI